MANACPAPSVKHIPQRPSAAFKDTPSQLSMKTLCIETRFWGSNMKKTQCHPRGQACSIAPDILPAAVVDENPCPRDTAVVWRVYKGEVRMVVNGGPGHRGSQSNLQPPRRRGQVMTACTTVAAPNNGHTELAFQRCYKQVTSYVSMVSGVFWA